MILPLLLKLFRCEADAQQRSGEQDASTHRDHAATWPHWRGQRCRGSSGARHAPRRVVPQHRAHLSAQGLLATCSFFETLGRVIQIGLQVIQIGLQVIQIGLQARVFPVCRLQVAFYF